MTVLKTETILLKSVMILTHHTVIPKVKRACPELAEGNCLVSIFNETIRNTAQWIPAFASMTVLQAAKVLLKSVMILTHHTVIPKIKRACPELSEGNCLVSIFNETIRNTAQWIPPFASMTVLRAPVTLL